MPHFRPLMLLANRLSSIQSILAFERWEGYHHFEDEKGIGRVAILATCLGMHLGVNIVLFLLFKLIQLGLIVIPPPPETTSTTIQSLLHFFLSIESNTLQMALQWTVYSIFLCLFHLGEYFSTCIYNPLVTSSDSFMINQSKAYTAAALISWAEFAIRIFFFPQNSTQQKMFHVGIFLVIIGQTCRTLAMVTCGESFNHYIQRDKKDNHELVTKGIYSILRHPSYFGFFYWSIGTQMILCNYISTVLYALAAWRFFHYRIPFEERTLRHHFGSAYDEYSSKTIVGIPFI